MFAPIGFVSLNEVVERLGEKAYEWRHATPHPDDPKPGGTWSADSFFIDDPNWKRSASYREWLFHCFLNRHEDNLFACTPSGSAIKLSRTLVVRDTIYEGPFEDSIKHWDMTHEHCVNPFCFITSNGYIFDLAHAEKTVPQWEFELMLPTLKQLDGYPVCWPLPNQKTVADWISICSPPTLGIRGILDMSPNGVSRRVIDVWTSDNSLTKAEIKRIVAPKQSVRQFELSWKLAAVKIPDIKKPGQKRGT